MNAWEEWREASGRRMWAGITETIEAGDDPGKHTLAVAVSVFGVPPQSVASKYVAARLAGEVRGKRGNPGYARNWPKADEVKAHYRRTLADLQEAKKKGGLGAEFKPYLEARRITGEHFHISEATVRNKVYRK